MNTAPKVLATLTNHAVVSNEKIGGAHVLRLADCSMVVYIPSQVAFAGPALSHSVKNVVRDVPVKLSRKPFAITAKGKQHFRDLLDEAVRTLPKRDKRGRFQKKMPVLRFEYKGTKDVSFKPRRVLVQKRSSDGFHAYDLNKRGLRFFYNSRVAPASRLMTMEYAD